MSYEGYEQHLCQQGHLWEEPCSYDEPTDPCPDCNGPSVWVNQVDDTNLDSWGVITEEGWKTLELTPEVIETCNLGHKHITKPATYRQPTPKELKGLRRHYEDSVLKPLPV